MNWRSDKDQIKKLTEEDASRLELDLFSMLTEEVLVNAAPDSWNVLLYDISLTLFLWMWPKFAHISNCFMCRCIMFITRRRGKCLIVSWGLILRKIFVKHQSVHVKYENNFVLSKDYDYAA